jgi:2-C-methyl-D-erythritol 2,4-cyclodiphosphate synthase
MSGWKIGFGYDIHRLVTGRKLVLGGVVIPHDTGLLGHSDADVVTHALSDAILGALNLGDIGTHFPPDDAKWKNANSLDLLRDIMAMARQRGASVVNVDVTVVAEAPRLAPFADQMRQALSEPLATHQDNISIKATTNEGVGPEGRCEAISATAVCLLNIVDA